MLSTVITTLRATTIAEVLTSICATLGTRTVTEVLAPVITTDRTATIAKMLTTQFYVVLYLNSVILCIHKM